MENNATNNKKTIIIVAIIAVIVIAAGIVLAFTLKKEEKPKQEKPEEKEEMTPEEIGNTVNDIMLIGVELYNNGKYLEFPKDPNNGYYATLGKLKELGYTNADSLVMNCHDNDRVIYFDVDHIADYASGMPMMTIYDCSK